MGNIADYMTPTEFNELEPHWTEKHITKETRYVVWDETGANKLGNFKTKGQAQQALIKYAKTLNKGRSTRQAVLEYMDFLEDEYPADEWWESLKVFVKGRGI